MKIMRLYLFRLLLLYYFLFEFDNFVMARSRSVKRKRTESLDLPNEILRDIFLFLDRKRLESNVRLTSRRFCNLVNTLKDAPYLFGGVMQVYAFFATANELNVCNLQLPPGLNDPVFSFSKIGVTQMSLEQFTNSPIPSYIRTQGLKVTIIWTGDVQEVELVTVNAIIDQLERARNVWAFPGCENVPHAGSLFPATNNELTLRRIVEKLVPFCNSLHITFAGYQPINIFRMPNIQTFNKKLKLDGGNFNLENFKFEEVANWLEMPQTHRRHLKMQKDATRGHHLDLITLLTERFEKATQPAKYLVEVHHKFTNRDVAAEHRTLVNTLVNTETGERLLVYGSTPDKYFAIERISIKDPYNPAL